MNNSFRLSEQVLNSMRSALGIKPENVVAQNALRTEFYRRWCWRYIYAMFNFSIPEEWDKGYFLEHMLMGSGLLGVTDSEYGVIALKCATTGVNFYEHPTELVFNAPMIQSFTRTIDVDCVPLYMDDFSLRFQVSPLVNTVNYFAEILAQCDGTISQNLMNSRIGMIVECEDKRDAKTARAVLDSFYNGEPAVFTQTGISGKINIIQSKYTYVSNEIQDLKRAIKNDFLSMFGYNNTNYTKKARQTVSEVDSNNAEIMGGITYWLETLKECMKKANNMFGLNLAVEMRPWAEIENIYDEPEGVIE